MHASTSWRTETFTQIVGCALRDGSDSEFSVNGERGGVWVKYNVEYEKDDGHFPVHYANETIEAHSLVGANKTASEHAEEMSTILYTIQIKSISEVET